MHEWEEFLSQQATKIGEDTVRKWLRPLKVVRYDIQNLYLEAENSFQAVWFEEHFRQKVQQEFVNHNKKKVRVHISVANANTKKREDKKPAKDKNPKDSTKIPTPPFSLVFDTLDPYCTFPNFVQSQHNSLAFKLLCEIGGYDLINKQLLNGVAPPLINPVYICGPSGTGKTHLLMALAQALHHHGKKVVFVRSETFTEHVVTAIRAGEMGLFREVYRNSDVLLLDDVHIFSRKGATQEELFHTFNTLHLDNKPIILTANCTPQFLQYIEPRLVSRFEWGITIAMEAPKHEELAKILAAKASAFHFPLSQNLLEFLLQTFVSSPKNVIKALEALTLRTHLRENGAKLKEMTVLQAKQILSDLIEEEQKHILTPTKIIQNVAEHYGICSDDILGKAQTKEFTLPRQVAMYLCRNKLNLPFMKIGDIFQRDHSTVMSSVRLIQKHIDETNEDITAALIRIDKKRG